MNRGRPSGSAFDALTAPSTRGAAAGDHAAITVERPDARRKPDRSSQRGVVAFDASPASHRALAFARGWARRTNADLIITYVEDPTWLQIADGYAAGAVHTCQQELAAEVARQAGEAMRGASVTWTYLVLTGPVTHELHRLACRIQADVVIVGHPRRRRLRLPRPSVSGRLNRLGRHIVVAVP